MTADAHDELRSLQELLMIGQRLSMQGSYERRAPAAESVPFLVRARDGFKDLTTVSPENVRAWRLLSQAQEALLEYGPALAAQHEAMRLTAQKDRRDLKRMALLKQAAAQWTEMPLSPSQLAQLGDYLREKLAGGTGDRTLRWTKAWLEEEGVAQPARVIVALSNRGGFSDFQVLSNVV